MLFRAKEGYLFDYAKNSRIVADDPWLRDIWAWVAGADEMATDGGMVSRPLDVGYMGIYTIWTNNLGEYLFVSLQLRWRFTPWRHADQVFDGWGCISRGGLSWSYSQSC